MPEESKFQCEEFDGCGVGFTVSRFGEPSHQIVCDALAALACVEHRGACGADPRTSDGAGVMIEIPYALLGYEPGSIAVAGLFVPQDDAAGAEALRIFEETFAFFGLRVRSYRDVPVDTSVLGAQARETMPRLVQAIIAKPPFVHIDESFNALLYRAMLMTNTRIRESGAVERLYFASLSNTTIVYKALTIGENLERFYSDLRNPEVVSRFAMFHRRFSTNTTTSWDKAQPFRLIGHNGEINTIAGNRAWAYSREQALGLPVDELLSHRGTSDSGNLNEMVEALCYRGSIPYLGDVLSIMIPPAVLPNALHLLWSRAMEPWDGPAVVTYCDHTTIGARLDRNGFRPCRWAMSDDRFYVSSEAGSFAVAPEEIVARGTLRAGAGISITHKTGEVDLYDANRSIARQGVAVDPRLIPLSAKEEAALCDVDAAQAVFGYTAEDLQLMLLPMAAGGKEEIGSMGNTARLAVLSDQNRCMYDYFYQHFAQVTNPPVDYIRERSVTDLSMYLGRTPNVFAPKELIPPFSGILLQSPILSIAQMTELQSLEHVGPFRSRLAAKRLHCAFPRQGGAVGLRLRLTELEEEAVAAACEGCTLLFLSDEGADYDNPPVPMLLALGAVSRALDRKGLRLQASLVVFSAEVRSAHHLACLIGFGASAVCPYLSIAAVRKSRHKSVAELDESRREANLLAAFATGLLRVMAKSGISVARSYHGSRLFTCIGLNRGLTEEYFPGVANPISGIGLEQFVERHLAACRKPDSDGALPNTYQFKEQSKGREGERHSMTVLQARQLHAVVRSEGSDGEREAAYRQYLDLTESYYPISLRHLWRFRHGGGGDGGTGRGFELSDVEPVEEITRRFGAGAMSFGAISAESQRDIFHAMQEVGGRSNSGEGGENPYYWLDGSCATIKQVASARFGVTGQYLISADEVQIKIAQGAKPGEGGQLMRQKVDEHIARARHASPGIDLISPPPLHDIYSIEDLKELIYELKQFNPACMVNVKLVSGTNIGTIAVGVAKAGADSIQISGGDGGTGAATLTSMKHAGLPWEIGLSEVHSSLRQQGLRECVELRVDGGLSTGKDIVFAALLGAEGYDFGKLLLVAEGCIMARLCQTNTCPVGIATHAERFKKKYKGSKEHVVALLRCLAEDVRGHLAALGARGVSEIIGRADLIEPDEAYAEQIAEAGLEFDRLLQEREPLTGARRPLFASELSPLNSKILADVAEADEGPIVRSYDIRPMDRAVPAALCGRIAKLRHQQHIEALKEGISGSDAAEVARIALRFQGSAGQGFGMLLEPGIEVELSGEANDSVCKSMSGGLAVLYPGTLLPRGRSSVLLGNCGLYGATGGRLFAAGAAGDRFAVRNSGAIAVIEGVGMHGCEYMTSGLVAVLGETDENFGAGMTGGAAYLLDADSDCVNTEYLTRAELQDAHCRELKALIEEHSERTGSFRAKGLLSDWTKSLERISRWVPHSGPEASA